MTIPVIYSIIILSGAPVNLDEWTPSFYTRTENVTVPAGDGLYKFALHILPG